MRCVDTDGLLERLKNTGVGCHMGSRFLETLAYAGDSVMMPSEIMVNCQIVGVTEKNSLFSSYCIDEGS